jgi:uncharacterized phage-associated protein
MVSISFKEMAVNKTKLNDLILYPGQSPHVESLGMTKLWKFVYFVDVAFLRETGRSLTGSESIKYDHGPVPSRGEKESKRLSEEGRVLVTSRDHRTYIQHHITTVNEGEVSWSPEERSAIDAVCIKLGRRTASNLSELSHDEPASIHAEKLEKLSPSLMCYGREEDAEGL